MKTKKHSLMAIIAAIIFSMAFVACGDDGDDDGYPTYTIDLGGQFDGYSVTIENRSGQDITAIISKLESAFADTPITSLSGTPLDNFKAVLDRGLVIIVDGGAPYGGGKYVNNRTISYHINNLSTSSIANISMDIKEDLDYLL
ncbi:MAG: hypothetical protein FWG13_00720 [Leptospirales bacterium]|nr:hypothetical protein [Leptospirales bacterium]